MTIWQRVALGIGAVWIWALVFVVYQKPDEKLNMIVGSACVCACAVFALKKR